MGMFDSLMVEIDGNEIELQSKRFDCQLMRYHLGDVVDGAPAGINVFFQTTWLGADGKMVYREEEAECRYTVFLVLAHAVFSDHVVVKGELRDESIEDRIAELREVWSDSGRLLARWVEFLREKRITTDRLQQQLHDAQSVVNYALDLQEGKALPDRIFGILMDGPVTRLREGEDPLLILRGVLSNEGLNTGWVRIEKSDVSPLEAYRL